MLLDFLKVIAVDEIVKHGRFEYAYNWVSVQPHQIHPPRVIVHFRAAGHRIPSLNALGKS